ncbi:DUF4349 domain-containing protein [Virgibacillus sp. W0430]|uniref:DUF4349 domain-containing protein n=1 Tax=Virgibacillus sp. W0430 TaxID=3391580 RepID=UPI003F46D28C
MKKRFWIILCFVLLFGNACSSGDSELNEQSRQDVASYSSEIGVEEDMGNQSVEEEKAESKIEGPSDKPSKEGFVDRMIIHQAQLSVNVKSIEEAQLRVEKKVEQYGGYIVQANVYKETEEYVNGHMTVRVPEKHFQQFLTDTEKEAADVLERNVTGQDVTEQYVDLESRLKSKRAVEERLLDFLQDATKTEDLLKISSDLANVQEEIEVLVGQMNYLENQSAYSTIEIAMHEISVNVPEVKGDSLDTWEKTKKQLATSTNWILATASGIVVFIVGNLPVFAVLFLVGTTIYFVVRKKRKKK